MTDRRDKIRNFLIQEIHKGSPAIARAASQKFKITRQAVSGYLKALVEEGVVAAEGNTKKRAYTLNDLAHVKFALALSPDLHEDKVWRDQVRPLLNDVPDNVLQICQYGFTEILNNAIDHSEGHRVHIEARRTAAEIVFRIVDDGVGIFNKIKQKLQLDDERQALLELAKGKLTTDAARHSGEGIFFTSRACDSFSIQSGKVFFTYKPEAGDWLLEGKDTFAGTEVTLVIRSFATRTLKAVFDAYTAAADDYGFSKTQIPVFLMHYGDENLISRSQAKRLLNRLDRFKEIIFDFQAVSMIGQAFADEVFRVFQHQHPDAHLEWINANPEVEQMIRRAQLLSRPDD